MPRYDKMSYQRCGISGLRLPRISLGFWHNWGGNNTYEQARDLACAALDRGITHFDLANTYGAPPGSAEDNFGRVLQQELRGARDEMVIAVKGGHKIWEGPDGDWGSRKYIVSSIDQSLVRLRIPYVDIFYHHRPDNETPLEETMGALDFIVRSGRALYIGLSGYSPELTREAIKILDDLGTPCIVHQPRYNMLERHPEKQLFKTIHDLGLGCVVYSPMAQGRLTDKYLNGVPPPPPNANPRYITKVQQSVNEDLIFRLNKLNAIAQSRGQTLSQMAVSWTLRNPIVTSALIGASRAWQLNDVLRSLDNIDFAPDELQAIDDIVNAAEVSHDHNLPETDD
jgi:L-glyceraldehyde 3-phosphate reductase